MFDSLNSSDKVILYAIPLFLIAIILEFVVNAIEDRKLYNGKDSIASIAMGMGSLFVNLGMKALALIVYGFLYQFRIFEGLETHWWAWVILFFADDFSFYWHHRLSHEVRILWAAHVNHHSSVNLNYSTALRQSWTELLHKYLFWLWLPIIGFHPIMILTVMSISLIFQFLQHTRLVKKLGPIEWIFNTPSSHRVHHASNVRYMDRNHAGILIIWDRIFGTYQEELDEDEPIYGITTNIDTYNPVKIATHEYAAIWHDLKQMPTFKDKVKLLLYPPGWSTNGPNQTAKFLQKQLHLEEQKTGMIKPSHKDAVKATPPQAETIAA
ncbi:sterol desaturase family protein [soil metagenome]